MEMAGEVRLGDRESPGVLKHAVVDHHAPAPPIALQNLQVDDVIAVHVCEAGVEHLHDVGLGCAGRKRSGQFRAPTSFALFGRRRPSLYSHQIVPPAGAALLFSAI
jgi:hypothetical protein